MKSILVVGVVLIGAGTANADRARQVRYVGVHPVRLSKDTILCYIEGPHVHVDAVAKVDRVQYRDHDGHNFFVGDPVAYGYDGPTFSYKGHHPIHVHVVVGDEEPDVEFCYLDGPHYHAFAPPPDADFKVAGGVHFYVGKPPRVYVEARPALIQINAIYRPLVYARPVVSVAAPAGWIGARVDVAAPAVVAPSVDIAVPSVSIEAPSLSFELAVGAPAVILHGHGHAHGHKHKRFKHEKIKHRKIKHKKGKH